MFNPIKAPLDGYYPSQRDPGGAFPWLSGVRKGVIFPNSRDEYNAGEFYSDEGNHWGPFATRLTNFPFTSGAGSWGGGPFLDNVFDANVNTAIAIEGDSNVAQGMSLEGVLDSWTWAAVLKHSIGPDAQLRTIFLLRRFFISFINYIVISERSDFGFRVQLSAGAYHLDVTPRTDAAADEGRGIRWVVTFEGDSDTLTIYQDGVEVASGVHNMTTPIMAGDGTTATWGWVNKGRDAYGGMYGGSCFQDICWTDRQVEAWAADPWGQYRQLYPAFFQRPFGMTADLNMGPAVAADMGMIHAVGSDLEGVPAVAADRSMGPAVSVNLEAGPAVTADLDSGEEN